MDNITLLQRLTPPEGKVSMVLDTDTYNEIDDQFAVVHALLSPEKLDVEAIYAAPFHNKNSSGPGDGMERSYEEILRLLDRLGRSPEGFVFRGSDRWLTGSDEPPASAAVDDLIERASADRDGPLYVVAIGAITNVAAALRREPSLVDRIVVVWLGGQPYDWPSAREFNLQQDPAASKLMFDSGVPLVHVPCQNVAEHIRTTVPEVEAWVQGRGSIGDYLCEIFKAYSDDHFGWSKVLWDISTIAWLLDPSWVPSVIEHSPILTTELTYSRNPGRHFVRVATGCKRDPILRDLFRKLQNAS